MPTPVLSRTDNPNVIYFGPRENPGRDRYIAENGLIHVENTSTGEYDTMTIRDFLQRMRAVSEFIGNSLAEDKLMNADELMRHRAFLDKAEVLARQAQLQGPPPELFGGKLRHELFSAVIKPKPKYVRGSGAWA